MRAFLCAMLVLALAAPALAAERLYVTSFQCGEIVALDTDGKVAWRLPVEDGAGIVGCCPSADGRLVYVVDGGPKGRLRVVVAASGKVVATHPVEDRACMLGGTPVASLSGEGRWLFLRTYDYGAAAAGMRMFDTSSGRMRAVGMRERPCDAPLLAAGPGGTLYVACGRRLVVMKEAVEGEFVPKATVAIPFDRVGQLVVGRDGRAWALEWGGASWRLAIWKPGGAVKVVDLGLALAPPEVAGGALAVSRDGKRVAVARGDRVWVLEPPGLSIVDSLRLPTPVDEVRFVGSSLLALSRYTLYRVTPKLEVLARDVVRGRGAPGVLAP